MNTDILYIMLGYIIMAIVIIVAIQWITKGFLMSYLRVKASRGKKQLMLIHSMTDSYWSYGAFDVSPEKQGLFHYKNRSKIAKSLTNVVSSDLYPLMGIFVLEVDDAKDMIIRKTSLAVTQDMVGKVMVLKSEAPCCSPEITDKFIDRAMKLPQKQAKTIVLLISLIVITMLIVLIGVYYGYKNTQAIAGLGAQLNNVSASIRGIL